jgi:hypothetical protein
MAIKDFVEKRFELECDCGCSRFSITRYDFGIDDDSISLSHYMRSWDAKAHPVRKGFSQMFKMIWCAITGKEYYFYDVVIDENELQKFKEFVAGL